MLMPMVSLGDRERERERQREREREKSEIDGRSVGEERTRERDRCKISSPASHGQVVAEAWQESATWAPRHYLLLSYRLPSSANARTVQYSTVQYATYQLPSIITTSHIIITALTTPLLFPRYNIYVLPNSSNSNVLSPTRGREFVHVTARVFSHKPLGPYCFLPEITPLVGN